MPSPFRYGMSAIFALIHDVLIVIGLFSILGKTIDLEINAMFITGVLTVIGYSVNDTIVVFDRVRENQALEGRLEKARVLCEELIRRREATGIHYITVGDDVMDAFAPVVARLAGQ